MLLVLLIDKLLLWVKFYVPPKFWKSIVFWKETAPFGILFSSLLVVSLLKKFGLWLYLGTNLKDSTEPLIKKSYPFSASVYVLGANISSLENLWFCWGLTA